MATKLIYYYAVNTSGDTYYGYFYDDADYSYGYHGSTPSERGGGWYYYVYGIYYGYADGNDGYSYVTGYVDSETGITSVPYYYGIGSYSGWDPVNPISSAGDYAYINGAYGYFDDYDEADGVSLIYYYAVNSSGDYYYGYFYDEADYAYGYQGSTLSESGTWTYYVYALHGGYDAALSGYNYVTDYYDAESGIWSTPYYYGAGGYSGWDPINPISSAADYTYNYGYYSLFDDYYEADSTTNLIYFQAASLGGDIYFGFFYDDASYELGFYGYTLSESGYWNYFVLEIYEGYASIAFDGYNYVTSYHDHATGHETGTPAYLTPYAYSNGGYSGWDPDAPISSASDYAYLTTGALSYFDDYYEA